MTKPCALMVDVQSCHMPGMCYVMLSRVQSLDQLNINKDLEPEKITVDKIKKVLKEAARMWKVSVNRNPSCWMDREKVRGLRVCSLNVRSLRKHIEDVRSDPVLQQADILFCQETWLTEEEERQEGGVGSVDAKIGCRAHDLLDKHRRCCFIMPAPCAPLRLVALKLDLTTRARTR